MSAPSDYFGDGVALVTGGSGVIGSAIARRLAKMGSKIVLNYRSNATAAKTVAEELRGFGSAVELSQFDLADAEAVRVAVQNAAERFGGVHSVVYAAGPSIMFRLIKDITPEEWARVISADANGCFNLISATLPHLRARKRSSILAVLTAAVDRSPPRDILSAAPKAAVQMLMRSVALEEGRNGIRANCVAPGYIKGGIGTSMIGEHDDAFVERLLKAIPMKRAGLADEVAEAAGFLLSDAASYVTGTTIHVAGGLQLA